MRNVELSQCDVFLPVYQVESIVSYQAIRKPTVFEKLILSLCVEHQKELSQYNLIQICKVLKIEQAFLKKSLDNLVDNDMLERNSQDLSDIYINILRLTNLGRDLYRRNEMPSNSKNVSIPFFYNPLLEKLVEKKNSWFTDVQAKKHIFSKEIFPENQNYIGQLCQVFIDQANEKVFAWKKTNTNISEIKCSVDKMLWQSLKVGLSLDHNGNIIPQSKGTHLEALALEQWLKQAQSEIVWEHLILPTFKKIEHDLQPIEWQDVLDVAMLDTVFSMSSAKLSVYVEKSPHTIAHGLEIILSGQAQTAKLQGKVLTVPSSLLRHYIGFQALYLDKENQSSVVFQGNTDIYYAKQARKVALQLRVKDVIIWQELYGNLLDLAKKNTDVLAFCSCFLTEQQVIDTLPILSSKKALDFNELMQKTSNKVIQDSNWTQKIKPLENMEDLNYFRKLFPQVKLDEDKLSLILMTQLIETTILESRTFNTIFDELLKPLTKINQELKSRINPDMLKQAISEQKVNIEKVNVKAIQIVKEWLNAYGSINKQIPNLILNTKKLIEQQKNLQIWQELVEQSFAPKRSDNLQVAIFDTSYLMQFSDKLAEITKHKFIIIPKVVLHELDGLKGGNNDEQTEQIKQARHAIRNIQNLPEEHFEPSHSELWYSINNNKTKRDLNQDEQILSVALYYRLNAAVLYSLDKNMCNLAKSVNIQVH
jgi:rRNA-processing protein FCF1/DNA-binding MarR family transcriptional regulator